MKGEKKLKQDMLVQGGHICDQDYHGYNGVTRFSLDFWSKIKNGCGDIVRAEMTYNDKESYRLYLTNTNNTVFEMRGFSSGFGGEGPRGLVKVLEEAGFNPVAVRDTVFKIGNHSWVITKYRGLVAQ